MRRLALLAGAVACFVGAGLTTGTRPAGAVGAPGSGLFGYTLTAQANGIQATEDQPSANSHPEAEGDLPHSQVSLTSGPVGYALSSVAWPGALAGNAGSLILLVRPDAPQQVTVANDPVRAEARTGGGSPDVTNTTVPGAGMSASARPAAVQAAAHLNGGDAGSIIGFGTTSSASKATLAVASAATSADSTAKDLLVAGVVKVGSVISHAEATTDGTRSSASGTTSVTGMTVAGVPVVVDDHGVSVASQQQAIDPVANETVNKALASLNMTVVLTKPTMARQGGTVSYDAGSLIFFWEPQGSRNVFTAHLGGARVLAAATPGTSSQGAGVPPTVPGSTSQQPGGPAPVPAAGGLVSQPSNPGGVPSTVLAPSVQPSRRPAISLQGLQEPVEPGTTAPVWTVLLCVLGAGLLLGGLWRVPALVLVGPALARCPLEEIP